MIYISFIFYNCNCMGFISLDLKFTIVGNFRNIVRIVTYWRIIFVFITIMYKTNWHINVIYILIFNFTRYDIRRILTIEYVCNCRNYNKFLRQNNYRNLYFVGCICYLIFERVISWKSEISNNHCLQRTARIFSYICFKIHFVLFRFSIKNNFRKIAFKSSINFSYCNFIGKIILQENFDHINIFFKFSYNRQRKAIHNKKNRYKNRQNSFFHFKHSILFITKYVSAENSIKNKFIGRINSLSLQNTKTGISTITDIKNITPTIRLVFDILTLACFLQITKSIIWIIIPNINPPQNNEATIYAAAERLSSKSRNGITSKPDEEIKKQISDIIFNTFSFTISILFFIFVKRTWQCFVKFSFITAPFVFIQIQDHTYDKRKNCQRCGDQKRSYYPRWIIL